MGFVAGCIGPVMVILLVVKLLDFFFPLSLQRAKTSHVYRFSDIRSDQGVSCDQE
jgi:hypothetical protein